MAYVAMSTDYVNSEIEGFAECVAKEKVLMRYLLHPPKVKTVPHYLQKKKSEPLLLLPEWGVYRQ